MSVPVAVAERERTTVPVSPGRRLRRRDPWHKPRFLQGFTWLYVLWSLLPVQRPQHVQPREPLEEPRLVPW
ncbi:MAG TPA: hypothetical protein VNN79_25235, partial [Actinomycetota bacterium]|nr:hypothetical protein [Actinomycetota bacterium]